MKLKITVMLMIFLLATLVYGATVPEDVDTAIIQKIDSEHKTTRQFVTNELTKREQQFLTELTNRADYYENSFENLTTKAIWNLGLLWAGIVLFIVSLNKMISNRTEQKKYQLLKESLKQDIINELNYDNISVPQKDITYAQKLQADRKKEKKGFWERRKEKKLEKEVLRQQTQQDKVPEMVNDIKSYQQNLREENEMLKDDFDSGKTLSVIDKLRFVGEDTNGVR